MRMRLRNGECKHHSPQIQAESTLLFAPLSESPCALVLRPLVISILSVHRCSVISSFSVWLGCPSCLADSGTGRVSLGSATKVSTRFHFGHFLTPFGILSHTIVSISTYVELAFSRFSRGILRRPRQTNIVWAHTRNSGNTSTTQYEHNTRSSGSKSTPQYTAHGI